jgi:DNA (cytosine-5)-methyltransferase 1
MSTRKLKHASLCTGIGGLDLAVEEHYASELVWYSDIEPDANKVMAHHFPGAESIGDLIEATPPDIPLDVLTMGFPCQAISSSGYMNGRESEKWLFEEIADFISRMKTPPQKLVIENVSNLISHDEGRTGKHVLGTLARLGYDVKWLCLRASDAGLPHQRKRFFSVATHTDCEPRTIQNIGPRFINREIRGIHRDTLNNSERSGLPMFSKKYGGLQPFQEFTQAIERWESLSGREAPNPISKSGKAISEDFVFWMMGFPPGWLDVELTRSAKLRLLGNAVAPPQASLALELIDPHDRSHSYTKTSDY